MRGRKLEVDWQEDEQTLYELYKQERDHQNRTRLQALWLLRRGYTEKEVAQIVGVHIRTVQRWVSWYREGSVGNIFRHRHGGHGGKECSFILRRFLSACRRQEIGGLHLTES